MGQETGPQPVGCGFWKYSRILFQLRARVLKARPIVPSVTLLVTPVTFLAPILPARHHFLRLECPHHLGITHPPLLNKRPEHADFTNQPTYDIIPPVAQALRGTVSQFFACAVCPGKPGPTGSAPEAWIAPLSALFYRQAGWERKGRGRKCRTRQEKRVYQ